MRVHELGRRPEAHHEDEIDTLTWNVKSSQEVRNIA